MNKTVKIISTLVIAILLVATLSQVCLAADYKNLISAVDSTAKNSAVSTEEINATAGKVIKLIRNVAAIAAVVILSILGIKYMMGSTEERAEYKKSFIPLVVGIIVVVSAASIASLLFSIA